VSVLANLPFHAFLPGNAAESDTFGKAEVARAHPGTLRDRIDRGDVERCFSVLTPSRALNLAACQRWAC